MEDKELRRARRESYMDCLANRKYALELTGPQIDLDNLYNEKEKLSIEYLEEELEAINLRWIQNLHIEMKKFDKRNLGTLSEDTKQSIENLETKHKKLCEYVADKRDDGSWTRK